MDCGGLPGDPARTIRVRRREPDLIFATQTRRLANPPQVDRIGFMHVRQIPISWAKRQAHYAVQSGLSLDKLFERALISPRHGDDRDRITPLQLTLLQAVLVLETNDGAHLMMRRRLDPALGPIGFRLLFSGCNLGDGLAALCKFYDISNSLIRYQLRTSGSHAFLAVQADDAYGSGLIQEDIQLVYMHLGLTCFLGRPFPVTSVSTRDPLHFNLNGEHYAIGGPVRLASCAGLTFSRALLYERPRSARVDEFLWTPMRDALHLLHMPGSGDAIAATNLTLRAPNLAADLNMAPSTLRRKLSENGLNFRQIREQTLLAEALELLQTSSSSIEAIAAKLGYSEARSFRRFVKRATGRTPDELRQELGAATPPAKLYERLKEVMTSLQP